MEGFNEWTVSLQGGRRQGQVSLHVRHRTVSGTHMNRVTGSMPCGAATVTITSDEEGDAFAAAEASVASKSATKPLQSAAIRIPSDQESTERTGDVGDRKGRVPGARRRRVFRPKFLCVPALSLSHC